MAGFEIHKQPAGTVLTVEFELDGQQFLVLNTAATPRNPGVRFRQ